MTNEWGAPLAGDEMKALKGRIDPEALVLRHGFAAEERVLPYCQRTYGGTQYHLPANHPYYKVRECNAKHGSNLVLHDGSAEVPDDFAPGYILFDNGVYYLETTCGAGFASWSKIIAYTPKPKESEVTKFNEKDVINLVIEARKFWQELCHEDGSEALDKALEPFSALVPYEDEPESEVTEQFPSDEAIEVALKDMKYGGVPLEKVKAEPNEHYEVLVVARLIQQYEPDRLKPAVDVAAEKYLEQFDLDKYERNIADECFKAGAAWQKENGK